MFNWNGNILDIQLHPTERDWILLQSWSDCSGYKMKTKNCFRYQALYYSDNLGVNWTQIVKYVNQFAWGALDQSFIDEGIQKERILVVYDPKGKGHQKISNGWS